MFINYTQYRKIQKNPKLLAEDDKRVNKNRFMVKLAIFFPPFIFPKFFPISVPKMPFSPVEGFTPQQIVRNARDRAESAAVEKKNAFLDKVTAPLAQCADDVEEAYNEYKVYIELSKTLSNVSKKARKDTKTNAGLDNLQEQLKKAEFHAGRGAKKLPGTKTVYYMRSGGQARLFFRYSEKERGAVEVIAEADKNSETNVIKNIKKNYD